MEDGEREGEWYIARYTQSGLEADKVGAVDLGNIGRHK